MNRHTTPRTSPAKSHSADSPLVDAIERLQNSGNPHDFVPIAHLVGPFVLSIANILLWPLPDRRDLAEEVSQEVLLAIWKSVQAGRFKRRRDDPEQKAWCWVSKITRRLSGKRRRSEQQYRRKLQTFAAQRDGGVSDDRAERRDALMHLHQCFSKLPSSDQEVLVLHFRGCTYEKIGVIIGVSKNTAYDRVCKAVQRLRAHWTL